jgi:hypothetical protein
METLIILSLIVDIIALLATGTILGLIVYRLFYFNKYNEDDDE